MLNREESQTLDSIRGMAAVVVLLMHTKQWFICPLIGWDHPSVFVSSHLAHFAVLVFFALSGYVITHSLISNAERNGGQVDARAYTRARLARILPPAIASGLFSLLVAALIIGGGLHGADSFRTERDQWVEREAVTVSARNVGATFLMSNGIIPGTKAIRINAPMWSLSLEFWAYFVALFAAVSIYSLHRPDRRMRSAGVIHLLAFCLISLFLAARPLTVFQYYFYWLIGALLYLRKKWPRPIIGILGVIIVAGVLAAIRCSMLAENWSLLFENEAAGIWGIPIKGALLIVLASLVPIVGKLPTREFFVWFSRSSYTLYLFHYPMLCLAFSFFHLDYLDWGPLSRGTFLFALSGLVLVVCHLIALPLENKRAWLSRFDQLWKRRNDGNPVAR